MLRGKSRARLFAARVHLRVLLGGLSCSLSTGLIWATHLSPVRLPRRALDPQEHSLRPEARAGQAGSRQSVCRAQPLCP